MNYEKEKKCDCSTKYCPHYESDFDRFVKENPYVQDTSSTCKTIPVPQEDSWEKEFDKRFTQERFPEGRNYLFDNVEENTVNGAIMKEYIYGLLSSQREKTQIEHCDEPKCPACNTAAYERGRKDERERVVKEALAYMQRCLLWSKGTVEGTRNDLIAKTANHFGITLSEAEEGK